MDKEYKDINPLEELIDKDEEARIFSEMSVIDGIQEYFRAVMARDLRNHFSCIKEQQDIVRGAEQRTEWFAKMVKKHSSVDKK